VSPLDDDTFAPTADLPAPPKAPGSDPKALGRAVLESAAGFAHSPKLQYRADAVPAERSA